MSNPNIKPNAGLNDIPMEQMRERNRKAAQASVKARRAKIEFKAAVIRAIGQDGVMDELVQSMINQAQKGDVRAFECLRDTSGQKPAEKQEITGRAGAPLVVTFDGGKREPV